MSGNGRIAFDRIVLTEGGEGEPGIAYAPDARNDTRAARNSPEFTVIVPEDFADARPAGGALLVEQGQAGLTGSEVFVESADSLAGAEDPTAVRAGALPGPAAGPAKGIAGGSAAATAFIRAVSDPAAGDGIADAVLAAADAGPSFFSAIPYGSSRYKTGSHAGAEGLPPFLGGAYGFEVSTGGSPWPPSSRTGTAPAAPATTPTTGGASAPAASRAGGTGPATSGTWAAASSPATTYPA
ncbi:MAG: hypothetical protein LBG06_00340, partial [Deltaproteobacteria bacterium]|nr:hypothetical protein [Deltaproteobacteria bacterium]